MEIKGLWSAGSIYYGSFEESFVAFMENKLGFFHYMNIEYDEIELFKWELVDFETISINGIAIYSFHEDILEKIDKSEVTNLKSIKFRKYKKVIFNNKEIDVLEFSQPLVCGDMEFGLEGKDVLSSHEYKRLLELIGEKLPKDFVQERKETMSDSIKSLNLPQETKDFLLKTKIEEDQFEDINIKFFNKKHGFLCDVVEWTKINDITLKDSDQKFVAKFLGELEKFRSYYVIAEDLNSGNLIAVQEGTGKIYELEHEVIEEVVACFVNSSFSKFYESMNYFKGMKNKILTLKKEGNVKEIEALFEKAGKELSLIDNEVVIDADEYNLQFGNGLLLSFEAWYLN